MLIVAMSVPPEVERLSGSAPRLPTRSTVLVMISLLIRRGERPDRLTKQRGEERRRLAPKARPKGNPGPKAGAGSLKGNTGLGVRGLRAFRSEP